MVAGDALSALDAYKCLKGNRKWKGNLRCNSSQELVIIIVSHRGARIDTHVRGEVTGEQGESTP